MCVSPEIVFSFRCGFFFMEKVRYAHGKQEKGRGGRDNKLTNKHHKRGGVRITQLCVMFKF